MSDVCGYNSSSWWPGHWPRLTCVCAESETLRLHHTLALAKSCQTMFSVSRPLQMLQFQSKPASDVACFPSTLRIYYLYAFQFYFDALVGLISWRIFTVDLINNRLIHLFLVWLDSSWRMYVKVTFQMLEITRVFFGYRIQQFLIYSWSKFWLTWTTDKRWWIYSNFSWLQPVSVMMAGFHNLFKVKLTDHCYTYISNSIPICKA